VDIPHPDLDPAAALSRRTFLSSCSALALSFAGCARLSPLTRAAYALVSDPPFAAYEAALAGIIRAVLPFERSDFPVTPAQVAFAHAQGDGASHFSALRLAQQREYFDLWRRKRVSHQTAVLRIGAIAHHDFRVLNRAGVGRHRVRGAFASAHAHVSA